MADELQELVDDPAESLLVEYKSWYDLTDNRHRADLARHIAALSNSGGGHIIFGFNNDMSLAGPPPAEFRLDTDLVSAITKRYLDPSVQCLVRGVTSAAGASHPVVIIPGHEATPICAKANGPEVEKKIVGITAGVYYLRKPGPESAPIISPAEWRDVIRRCALHDRAAILSALSGVISGAAHSPPAPAVSEVLKLWAERADAHYIKHAPSNIIPVNECRAQFSYIIEKTEAEALPLSTFQFTMLLVANEVDRTVKSGWSVFYVFQGAPLAPHWQTDPDDEWNEYLEACYFEPDRNFGLDMWRLSPTGMATTIRELWEDSPRNDVKPRTTLNPKMVARELAEVVRHAQAFGSRFETATHVTFRCEWKGLAGRVPYVPYAVPFHSAPAVTNSVVTQARCTLAEIDTRVPNIVADLGGRLFRALNWNGFDTAWVAQQEASWPNL